MRKLEKLAQAYFNDELFTRNRRAAYKLDTTIIRTVLIGAIICYVLLFCASFRTYGFDEMRWLYVALLAIFAVLLSLSYALKDKAVSWLFYSFFFSFIGLCTYSSSFKFPDSISVMVLLALFMFPALFLDKSWRLNLVSVVMAAFYLVFISFYKTPECFSEELVNVLCFTLLGCIVGSYTRRAQLHNFDTMEQLRISREQYRLAVEQSKGVICEYDVAQRCIVMKSKLVPTDGAAQKYYNIPYDAVEHELVSKDSSEEYIRFFEAIIKGEKTGSTEYCAKTEDGWRWQRAVFTTVFSDTGEPVSAVISLTDITEQRAQEEAQRLKAEIDGLTGVYNRATTEALVDRALAEKCQGALLLVDLDNLKLINDSLGHPQGDAALRAVAQALQGRLRQTDVVGRVGGDEFVGFVRGANSPERVAEIARHLEERISACHVGEDASHSISASIGIALCASGDRCFEDLYKRADIALYSAKKNGKNRYEFFA